MNINAGAGITGGLGVYTDTFGASGNQSITVNHNDPAGISNSSMLRPY